MSEPTPAPFSSEAETKKHVSKMDQERKDFTTWWHHWNLDGNLDFPAQLIAWEAWKASARSERPNV